MNAQEKLLRDARARVENALKDPCTAGKGSAYEQLKASSRAVIAMLDCRLLEARVERNTARQRVDDLEAALRDIVTGESHILCACDGCGGVCHVERAEAALGED